MVSFVFPFVSALGHEKTQDLLPFLGWGTGRWICCGLLEWVRGGSCKIVSIFRHDRVLLDGVADAGVSESA